MADALLPVLVTDDSPQAREILCLILNGFGIPAIDVSTPEETLQICQTQAVALVISDIMKPGMDGYELLSRLRTNPVTEHIPFMFVSSMLGFEPKWKKR